jgi:hypothetical protein
MNVRYMYHLIYEPLDDHNLHSMTHEHPSLYSVASAFSLEDWVVAVLQGHESSCQSLGKTLRKFIV